MVYLRLVGVGDRAIDQPLLLDTGSSGMTVDCNVVLPRKLCSTKGIRISEDTETDGILVTTQKIVAHYGTYDEYGNLAYAVVRFGSAAAPVKTSERIAFLLRYKKVNRFTGEVVGGPLWPKGIVGISPVGGIGPDEAIASPLAAVPVGDGLHRGYSIGPIGRSWKVCTIEDGNCPEVDGLSIGFDPQAASQYKFAPIRRADPSHNFPSLTSCLAFAGNTICKPALFDTGNSTIIVGGDDNLPGEPLPAGTNVKLLGLMPWAFTTEYTPEVEFNASLDHHIIGIRYFEENGLAVDMDTSKIGLKASPD